MIDGDWPAMEEENVRVKHQLDLNIDLVEKLHLENDVGCCFDDDELRDNDVEVDEVLVEDGDDEDECMITGFIEGGEEDDCMITGGTHLGENVVDGDDGGCPTMKVDAPAVGMVFSTWDELYSYYRSTGKRKYLVWCASGRWHKDIIRKHTIVKVAYHDSSKTEEVQRYDKAMVALELVVLRTTMSKELIEVLMEQIRLMAMRLDEKEGQ
uniref:Uncharacterized protein n=1 Tax=Chenopodium quinoa TaxID=63459 RepID=A0A803N1K1_CHEQI